MKKLWSEKFDEEVNATTIDPSEDIERRFACDINEFLDISMSSKEIDEDETGLSLTDMWDDEYKMYKGGGLQWTTKMAYRSKRDRQIRPNSEDNFIFNMIQIQVANITSNPIEARIEGIKKKYNDISTKLTHLSLFNDQRNELHKKWEDWVTKFIAYGPLIVEVCWDNDWIGGTGSNRWIGDVRLNEIDKRDFFPDPAILNLQDNINDCAFIGIRKRKKLMFVQKKFPRFKNALIDDNNQNELQNEGSDPEMVDLWKVYHRGFPEYMPEERVKELRELAVKQESEGDYYKAQDLYEMAQGNIEGIHLAYYANQTLLEYIPYVYDDNEYPIVFTTRYTDENSQWGWGEIRNTKIPQIMHNKADEIEIEAMTKEGLGGGYFNKGAISRNQMDHILTDSGKGGMWFEVDQVAQIKERTGVKVPSSIINYKEHKQRMIETVSSITPIQQGMAPGSNMPFKAISELGARTDVRMKKASSKLEHFFAKVCKLRINRFAQFYTDERYYRYTESDGTVSEGTFTNDEIFDIWEREMIEVPQVDPMTGMEFVAKIPRRERFIPEFDVKVTVLSSKPNDRNYYTSLAMQLYQMQLLSPEDLLSTLEEGKLPSMEVVLEHIYARQPLMDMMAQIQQLPQELQQVATQQMQQTLSSMMQNIQQIAMLQQQNQGSINR